MSTEAKLGSLVSQPAKRAIFGHPAIFAPSSEITTYPDKYLHLLSISKQTLDTVIKEDRIEASADGVFLGGDFTRDGAITAVFVQRAETLRKLATGEEPVFTPRIAEILIKKIDQQSRINIPERGVKIGQFPHEVRKNPLYYERLVNPRDGGQPWFRNPENNFLENYDASDSTGLWIYAVGKYIEAGYIQPNEKIYRALQAALEYCLGEIDEKGFVAYEYEGNREFVELRNKTWKDSERGFLLPNGQMPKGKIYDIWTNGVTWAALDTGARIFAEKDPDFSRVLFNNADEFKERLNNPISKGGFRMRDEFMELDYFAEALTEQGALTTPSVDPALLLGLYVNGECPIKEAHIPDLVTRVMKEDMFDEAAGIRTYSNLGEVYHIVYDFVEGFYHRGPETVWPWNNEKFATGAEHYGFVEEAKRVRLAVLEPLVNQFDDRPIELHLKGSAGERVPYKNPQTGQLSCFEQAWSAGAVYEAVESLRITT